MAKTLWPEIEEDHGEGGNLPRGAHTRGVSNNFMPDERLSDRDRSLALGVPFVDWGKDLLPMAIEVQIQYTWKKI